MNLGESWPTGFPSSASSPSSGQVAGRIFNGLADANKAKGHWQKDNLDFWSSGARCCCCSYAIHKSCTLIKGHTQSQDIIVCRCPDGTVCCRCCGSPLWLIVCQKDCPFKIAIRRACWQVILAKTLLVQPCLASASACVWPEWLGSRAERLTRLPALSQLSHSCQRAINAIYSFIFANLRRRHRWQRQRDTSRCPSNLNIKQPKKSCSCVCNAILFDLFEKKIE